MSGNKIAKAGNPAGAPLQRKPNPTRHILVVDDEPCIREICTEVLIQQGYHVDTAGDGAAAWQALNSDSYDLLVTDHNMPKVSGVELLKKLRTSSMALPVILVTGMPPAAELERHPWLQIDAILLKPFTCHELLVTVKKVLHAPAPVRAQM